MGDQQIGRYKVVRELGQGGMATVYLARDPSFERLVAVKVLPQKFSQNPEFRARFRREAKVIAALEHSYIVPVYDYGEEGDQPFIVMRYMTGGSLADQINGKPMRLAEVLPILQRVGEALDEAHSRGIIHRDLKPSNIMFDGRGNAFLSDFGIAKLLEATIDLTGSGVVGTPAYMSPEQAMGDKEIDPRSDIYSLGVILFEMLTGQRPYKADTPWGMMRQHISEPPPTLDTAKLGLPDKYNAVLGRALAKAPADRFPTAGGLAKAVSTLAPTAPAAAAESAPPVTVAPAPPDAGPAPRTQLAQDAAGVPPPTSVTPSRRFSRRSLLVGGVIGVPVLVGGVIGVPVMAALVMLAMFLRSNGSVKATATPTLTSTSPPTAAASATIAPSATLAPTPTTVFTLVPAPATTVAPSATLADTPTPTPIPATATPTRRPPTATSPPPTQLPTDIPTVTMTATPVCGPGEFFDPVMNTCRQRSGGGGGGSTPVPP